MSGAPEGPETGRTEVVVVGAGLAGLAAAHGLAAEGRGVLVLEAAEEVGGRARTVWHRGRPVDRGFQTLFRAYPETKAFTREIGLPRRDMRPVSGGAVFHHAGWSAQLRPSPAGLLRFDGIPLSDRRRLAVLGAEALRDPQRGLLDPPGPAATTEEYLRDRGFSEESIEGFFRPLFGVIFLDRSLSADPGYFRFLLGMLGRGPAVIPSDGLGMIAEWAAASIRQREGRIETGARVTALETDAGRTRVEGVRLADGRRIEADVVVLATEAPAASRLLAEADPATASRMPDRAASSVTAAFALSQPLYSGKVIVLDCDPDPRPERRVDLICQTTNVTRPKAVEGPHVLLATRVTTGGDTAEGIEEATERLVARWAPRFAFSRLAEHIGTYEHHFAQFRPLPGVRAELPGTRTALANLVLAGDLTRHPSIEGAVGSGRHAASVVAQMLS